MIRDSKFGNMPTRIDGRLFHSRKEARRYQELKTMQAAGLISDLECQPVFDLSVGGVHICRYVGDFQFIDLERGGVIVVEDVKGWRTEVYRLKAKLMKAVHGIEVQEI